MAKTMIVNHNKGTFKLNTAGNTSNNRDEAYSPMKVDVFKKQFNRFINKSRASIGKEDEYSPNANRRG